MRPTCGEQMAEQVARHRLGSLGQHDVRLELLGLVVGAFFRHALLAGHGIDDVCQVRCIEAGFALVGRLGLQENVAPHDLADCEVAVLDGLRDVVAVGRFAEVADIVGGDRGILQGASFLLDLVRKIERARRGGQADLKGRSIALQHLGPCTPGRAMTFVDDDDVEVVRRIVGREERKLLRFILVDSKALVGGNVNAGVLRLVATVRVPRDLGRLATEKVRERGGGLCPQFVAIAHEERTLGHAGIEQALQKMRRDECLTCTRREGQQGASVATGDLLEDRSDGGILIVAPRTLAAAIGC